jgi:hypothetical protein
MEIVSLLLSFVPLLVLTAVIFLHRSIIVARAELVHLTGQIKRAGKQTEIAAALLATNLEVTRMLAVEDRLIMSRLVGVVDDVDSSTKANQSTGLRIEHAAACVADDLAASHVRADEAVGPHGAAADAASKTV